MESSLMAKPTGKKRGRPVKDKVDRDLLHEYLWKTSARGGMVSMSQTVLADKLGVTIFTISHIFREMKEGGRLKKIGPKYYVVDPEVWRWNHAPVRDPRLF